MYATTFDQIPAAISSATAALESFEAAVYRADAVYQAEVVPRIFHAGIIAAHIFVQATIRTFVAGDRTGRWFWATVDRYATPDDALFFHVTPDHLELCLLSGAAALPVLPGFVPVALLCEVEARVLVTPAVLPSSKTVCIAPPANRCKIVAPVPQMAMPTTRAAKSVARLNLSVCELRALAKERGVKNAARMSKATLQALLAV
jgi:hypothetical protein